MSLIMSVEDDILISQQLNLLINNAGHTVVCFSTLRESIKWLGANSPDVILLDVELPDGSGIEMCTEIRKMWSGPIIFLSGHGEYVVAGLRAGGDDFVKKPFDAEELLARIDSTISRSRRLRAEATEIKLGELKLDNLSGRALWDGTDLGLKPKEFLILHALVRNVGQPISTDELYNTVWGNDSGGDIRTVHVHISTLRRKMREAEIYNSQIIKVPDNGYVYCRGKSDIEYWEGKCND